MAKVAKVKTKTHSLHSRAAKRATSPSLELNLDKSLQSLPRPETSAQGQGGLTHKDKISQKVNALGLRGDQGIAKKRSSSKVLSTKARKRKEAAMDKGEARMEKLEVKRDRSFKRGKVVRERAVNWDELNGKIEITDTMPVVV